MRLLHEIAFFQTVKSKVIISLFETVRLTVSISLRKLYNSLNSIKERKLSDIHHHHHLPTLTSSLYEYFDHIWVIISSCHMQGAPAKGIRLVGVCTVFQKEYGNICVPFTGNLKEIKTKRVRLLSATLCGK